MYKLVWQFQQRWLLPLDPNPERVLYWMLHSGQYIPDAKFGMSSGYGIPVQHMRAFMFIFNNPTEVSMEQIYDVFCFTPGCSWQQYYIHDDPYDISFVDAKEQAADFCANGGFMPVQNGLLNGKRWHEAAEEGRYYGDHQPTTAPTMHQPCDHGQALLTSWVLLEQC